MDDFMFFLEVLIGGLLSGVMYALVALGFVLIYKASSVFNFAQGAMVFFAVLSFVGFMELGLNFWVALPVTVLLMVITGMVTERLVLRPLVNQNEDALLMATIGLAFVLEGAAQLVWGVEVRRLDLGIPDVPIEWLANWANIYVSTLDVVAGIVAALMVAVLSLIFARTKVGLGLRAVADGHAAAMSIGIPLKQIWMLVWATAGIVALVAGMLWGTRSGVQFALIGTALKALPVLIIGGFTSVPGVIVAGLIVGATEKLAEVYIGPYFGGGIEGWAPYMLAVLFLLVRFLAWRHQIETCAGPIDQRHLLLFAVVIHHPRMTGLGLHDAETGALPTILLRKLLGFFGHHGGKVFEFFLPWHTGNINRSIIIAGLESHHDKLANYWQPPRPDITIHVY